MLVCSWFIARAALLLLQVQIRSREGTRLVFCVVLVEWQAWERQRELGLCCFAQKKKGVEKKEKWGERKKMWTVSGQAFFFFFVFWPLENYVVPCEGKKFYIDPHIFPLLPFGSWLYFIFFAYSISDPHSCCPFFFFFFPFSFFFLNFARTNKIKYWKNLKPTKNSQKAKISKNKIREIMQNAVFGVYIYIYSYFYINFVNFKS